MFRIKICGVTSCDDARAAVQVGADMVGLNFYADSPRFVDPELAREIAAAVPQTTGVFVNASAAQINRIADIVGLDWVQLHGDEPPELLADLRTDLPVIRVRSMDAGGLPAIVDDWEACRRRGRQPAALLVDATVAGQYGGTGKTADWSALADRSKWLREIPLILAGGLHAGNVGEAISLVQPEAVDTASGVEVSPGVKSIDQLRSFSSAAQTAFAELAG